MNSCSFDWYGSFEFGGIFNTLAFVFKKKLSKVLDFNAHVNTCDFLFFIFVSVI